MPNDERNTAPAAFPRLFSPLRIGPLTVRNRIVNTTHGTGLGADRDVRYLQERARGGAGLLGVHGGGGVYGYALGPGPEAPAPDWDHKALSPVSAAGIAFYDETTIPALRRRAEVIHAEGALGYGQVYHSGAARHGAIPGPLMAPSAVADPYEALVPHPLDEHEIAELVVGFAHSIRRIAEAGLDAAEIHGAHGYLVNQFLSPWANRRTDGWGGDRERRLRFVREVLAAARAMVGPDFPIGIRIGADGDGESRGITIEELAGIAGDLGDEVAWVSVSGGNYAGFGDGPEVAYVSPWYREPGFNVAAAAAVRAATDVPVLVTGRIADLAIAESVLAEGHADLVGMVRALIADPDLPNKARAGRAHEVRMCLGMSECHAIGSHRVPVTCAVNAAAAREDEMELVPTETARKVVVVGAGPAGMEAARVAAERGHEVWLADASRQLGGTPAVLALDPNRRNLRDHAAWFEGELRRLGVQLVLGNAVTADELVDFGADVVVVATGARPLVPDVPGIADPRVVTALDVLGGTPVGSTALVVGEFEKHLGPPTVAEFLADRGAQVELVSQQFDFASGAEDGTRLPLRQRLAGKGVTVSLLHRLVEVDEAGAVVEDTLTRERRHLADATVVLACGSLPDDRLARELRGRVPEVHVVGDALAPRRMMHATLEGARVALAL
ncbi:FAD-dependent oxidoreductase [Rhabdothermincola salaria]|uniref:oxidoreductase n=1 Tax=Rhabdothermincola salaria TaxID=2903142 RepID=UPI001E50C8EF|nr:FAD-dependent oxidoreductase [Rhabdothermincola salaria]MCD9624133.1 FAD-dependent oxidoreductase [Rhabdothermincola salaria]